MKVAVLEGGKSNEREISLKTSRYVKEAIRQLGYELKSFDPINDNWQENLLEFSPDVVFIALHGGEGENGKIQAWLEINNFKHTSSPSKSCFLAMDKFLMKEFVKKIGVTTPKSVVFLNKDFVSTVKLQEFKKVVLKPLEEGSSFGIQIKQTSTLTPHELKKYFDKWGPFIAEEYIEGQELTIGMVGGQILPPVLINPKKDFFDYQAKYEKGMTEYKVVNDKIRFSNLISQAKLIFETANFKHVCRLDFIYANNQYYFLEANTVPGMTETSLIPMSAKSIGIEFENLIDLILKSALNG